MFFKKEKQTFKTVRNWACENLVTVSILNCDVDF